MRRTMLKRFVRDRSGATVIEYGLIVAVLSLAMMVGLGIFGNSVTGMFNNQAAILDKSVSN
jgi:pilus assembly protein Flp/PilA